MIRSLDTSTLLTGVGGADVEEADDEGEEEDEEEGEGGAGEKAGSPHDALLVTFTGGCPLPPTISLALFTVRRPGRVKTTSPANTLPTTQLEHYSTLTYF